MIPLLIDAIKVNGRHRQNLGDLTDLRESIAARGLLHPVVVTETGDLIAGQRRLEACRQLGWEEIPVTVAGNLTDATDLLLAERDENTCRLDMAPSEKVALGRALEELERPRAKARQRASGESYGKGSGESPEPIPGRSETRDVVGLAVGMSGFTYHRAKKVVEAAESGDPIAAAAVEEMDRSGKVNPAYRKAIKGETTTKSPKPPRLDTDRGIQIANKSRERLWAVVSGLPDRDALDNFDVSPALAVATDEDKDNWVRMLGDSIKALRELRTRLQQGG